MQRDDLPGTRPLHIIERTPARNILLANAKGGCGKSTMATNLAAYFSNRGRATALMDYDPQSSSTHWLKLRPETASPITGITAFTRDSTRKTRSFHNRLPRGIERVVIDSPAGISGATLYNCIRDADLIIVPLLPSPIDIHAATEFIREIEITGCLRERNKQVLVIANRVKTNTLMFKQLNQFLHDRQVPLVTHMRDSQLYPRYFARGLAIADLARSSAEAEKDRWVRLGSWIENQFALRASGAEHLFDHVHGQLQSP